MISCLPVCGLLTDELPSSLAAVKMLDKDKSGTIDMKDVEAWVAAEADEIEVSQCMAMLIAIAIATTIPPAPASCWTNAHAASPGLLHQARNFIRNFARFREVAPSKMTGIGGLIGNLINGYCQMTEYVNTTNDDIARTVPIETGYVTVTDFDTEEADKHYLREQGRLAIKQWGKDLLGSGGTESSPPPPAPATAELPGVVVGP